MTSKKIKTYIKVKMKYSLGSTQHCLELWKRENDTQY